MTKIRPDTSRAIISATPSGFEVVIPTGKKALDIFVIVFGAVWLVGWAFGEFFLPVMLLIGAPIKRDVPLFFLACWYVVWTIAGGFLTYVWLWKIAGKEIITVNGLNLAVRKDLFGYGRVEEYAMSHIANMRVLPQPPNPFTVSYGLTDLVRMILGRYDYPETSNGLQFWGISGGVLAFDHGARTCSFGMGIDEAEANQIMSRIEEDYPILFGALTRKDPFVSSAI